MLYVYNINKDLTPAETYEKIMKTITHHSTNRRKEAIRPGLRSTIFPQS